MSTLIEQRNMNALKLLIDPNDQTAVKAILNSYIEWRHRDNSPGGSSVEKFIAATLKDDLFEVLEASGSEIKAIKKKSTGEIFRAGDSFWSTKIYQHDPEIVKNGGKLIEHCWFDHYLTGYTDRGTLWKNWIRGNSGLYSLVDIMTLERKEHSKYETPIIL